MSEKSTHSKRIQWILNIHTPRRHTHTHWQPRQSLDLYVKQEEEEEGVVVVNGREREKKKPNTIYLNI